MSDIHQTHLPPSRALAVRATLDVAELPAFFSSAFRELFEAAERAGAHIMGPPFARYHTVPPEPIDVEAMLPVDAAGALPAGRVRAVDLPETDAVEELHVGGYDAMAGVYDDVARFLTENGLEAAEPPREVYLTGPDAAPPRTLVVQPTRAAPAGRS